MSFRKIIDQTMSKRQAPWANSKSRNLKKTEAVTATQSSPATTPPVSSNTPSQDATRHPLRAPHSSFSFMTTNLDDPNATKNDESSIEVKIDETGYEGTDWITELHRRNNM